MAKKPTTRKKLGDAVKKAANKLKPKASKRTSTKPGSPPPGATRSRPGTKSKRVRVDGAIGALDEVLTGVGAERAETIRQRVRSILNSFR